MLKVIVSNDWNYLGSLGNEWETPCVGNFVHDGSVTDGRDDVVLLKNETGDSGIWHKPEDDILRWSALDQLSGGEMLGSGDFDGNGIDDILIRKGDWVGAWLNGTASEYMGIVSGLNEDDVIEGIGDFNNDGKDDLLFRGADGRLGALIVNGPDSTEWKEFGTIGKDITIC